MRILVNYILIGIVVFFILVLPLFLWKLKMEEEPAITEECFEIPFLLHQVHECLSEMIHMDFSKFRIRENEMEKRKKSRALLRKALDSCAYGDKEAKDYVKECIKALLQNKCKITPDTIELAMPFEKPAKLTVQDKFDILLYIYRTKREMEGKALEILLKKYALSELRLSEEGKMVYEVCADDIEMVYLEEVGKLTFPDKLEVLTQRIFSMDKGNGVIDDLIYQKLDGVSGGVLGSGETSFASVFIMMNGKTIYLSFLSFGSERELSRICKNIYRYDAPGQLSRSSGYIVNYLKSGARVSDMRPPFGSNWCFWIRMFDSVEKVAIHELYPQKGNEILAELLYFIIKGEQTSVISGQQGTGKTTCLAAVVDYINPSYNIRTIELTYELQLNKVYPKRNIAAMRETKTIHTESAIEFVKKTDADVVIFGEIAKETEGEKMVKISQSGSKFTLSTHHGVTTKALIKWFRNALLHSGGFHEEQAALEQVTDVLRFDIHLAKKETGERVVERITEIVPKGKTYEIKDILRYQDGEYKLIHSISKETSAMILLKLDKEEKQRLGRYMPNQQVQADERQKAGQKWGEIGW